MPPKKVVIKRSPSKTKKMVALFTGPNNFKKTVHFGEKGASDYTKHKNAARKQLYLKRHKKRESWNKPMTAGSLSRWILWNKPTLTGSIRDYKKKFKLK